ncbi:MAG TPA: GTPase domain-containing protein [Thermoanaerobaculia bacterium]|jgi:signal recognition particle receptor subunit beta
MVLFNHATREMTAKIVYYGPGLCGKTTNLMVIFDKLAPEQKGKMLSLATKTDRTLFFDLLPVEIGKVGPFNLKIQLYTVPGQVFYNETRKLVLRGADSVVFVADSQPAMVDANKESFANLLDNLEENNIDVNDTPIVIQFNKRDLPGVLPVEALQEALGFEGYPYTEAAAVKGQGVMETFKLVSKITAKHLFNRLKGGKSEPVKKAAPAAAMATAAKVEVRPAPEPDPEPEPLVELAEAPNPFADSVPFETVPEETYEKAEEVSLEQLLAEGRERPATFSGNVPLPHVEEVEELGADEMLPLADEAPIEVAVEEELPPPISFADHKRAEPEGDQVQTLQQQLERAQEQHRIELQAILRELDALAARVRAQLTDGR